jgi:hypothetical protein
MAFEILVHEVTAEELEALRVFDHRQILEAVEAHLTHQPNVPTRRRKCLSGLTPSFEHVAPVWELRVGTIAYSTMSRRPRTEFTSGPFDGKT